MADSPPDQVQVHRRSQHPRSVRGRDGHAAAFHDRDGATSPGSSPRRRSCCRSLGFALGPQFELHNVHWQDVGLPDDFTKDTYVPKVITIVDGIGEAGKSTAYVRKFNPEIDSENALPAPYNRFIAISTRCMHLGCPVHYVQAAERFICPCHGGVYDFRGAVVGGPPVRPLDRFYTRVTAGPRPDRPALLGQQRVPGLLAARPGEPLDGIGQYLYPSRPSVRKIPGT